MYLILSPDNFVLPNVIHSIQTTPGKIYKMIFVASKTFDPLPRFNAAFYKGSAV